MKIFLLVGLVSAFCCISHAQQTEAFLQSLEHPAFEQESLKPENVIHNYLGYDLSTLLIPTSTFLGYLGEDYQRLRIYYTSIIRDAGDSVQYLLSGVTISKGEVVRFKGAIRIRQVREYKRLHEPDMPPGIMGITTQGIIIADYRFEGIKKDGHPCQYVGVMVSYWGVDRYGLIHPDDVSFGYSDRYCNNQYVGNYSDNSNPKGIVANWGERRIPFSGKLDIGASGFSPDSIYNDKGWNSPDWP